jgi:hypothetical protein
VRHSIRDFSADAVGLPPRLPGHRGCAELVRVLVSLDGVAILAIATHVLLWFLLTLNIAVAALYVLAPRSIEFLARLSGPGW